MRAVTSHLIYPVTLIASLATVVGLSSHAPVAVAAGASQLVAIAAVGLAERSAPWSRAWHRSHGDVRTDLCHLVVSSALLQVFVRDDVRAAIARPLGGAWPHALPVAAQVAIALLLAELVGYWAHRLLHVVPALWRFHAVHHSARRLYWLNAVRNHPVDTLLTVALPSLVLAALGADATVLVLHATLVGAHSWLQHANVDVRPGPLGYVFSTTELHRLHHANAAERGNANYGGTLIVWDLVFGTRRDFPWDGPPIVVGLERPSDVPSGYLGQLAAPFRARSS